MMRLLTAIGLTLGGSSTIHIYTKTTHRTTQLTTRTTQLTTKQHNSKPDCLHCGPCPFFASYSPSFALQLRRKRGKTSVRGVKKLSHTKVNYC